MPQFRFRISAGFCIVLCILIATVPLKWLCAALIAAAIHEFGHLAAIFLFKKKVFAFELGIGKAEIIMEPLELQEQLVCACAGPLAGACLIAAYRHFPRIALCAAAQTAYNCIPILPMDGGRVLFCLCHLLFPEKAAYAVLRSIRYLGIIAMLCAVVFIFFVLRLRPAALALFIAVGVVWKKNSLQTGFLSGTIGEARR